MTNFSTFVEFEPLALCNVSASTISSLPNETGRFCAWSSFDCVCFRLVGLVLLAEPMDGVDNSGPRYKHTPGKGLQPGPSRPLYAWILIYLHAVYFVFSKVRRGLIRIYDTLTGFVLTSSSRELIMSDISTLNKIPSHLAVIVSEPDLENLVSDVSDLAAWAICTSIPILTIYNARGDLKGMESSLQMAIKRKIRRYFRDIKKIVINTPAWGTSSNNFGEDDLSIPDLEINLLSREDGREAILDLTRSLCSLVQQGELSSADRLKADPKSLNAAISAKKTTGRSNNHHDALPKGADFSEPLRKVITKRNAQRSSSVTPTTLSSKDITISFLDAHLSSSTISEPNLLLVFGRDKTLAGFPPWSMRLCEICHLGRSPRVTYGGYLRGLQRYGRAEMRFGH